MASIKDTKKTENIEKPDKGGEVKKVGNSAHRYLIEPWITEKSHAQMASNKYIFKVFKVADKKKVASAVEALYGVKVVAVNVVNIPSKSRRYGSSVGKKSGYKKAIVSLKEGDKIDIFQGA